MLGGGVRRMREGMEAERSSSMRALFVVLLIVGIAALAVGVIYFTVPVGRLPSFMGRIAQGTGHRSKRATAGVALGILLLAGSLAAFLRARRPGSPAPIQTG